MRWAYMDLVGKQSEIIEKQLGELSRARSVSEKRGRETSSAPSTHGVDTDARIKQLMGDYLNVEDCLEQKLAKIDELTSELNTLISEKDTNTRLAKTSKRLHASIEVDRRQSEKLRSMECALERIDDIISLKQKSVETLESELKRLEELALLSAAMYNPDTQDVDEKLHQHQLMTHPAPRITKSTSTSSTTSSQSSTSSLFTSISSINSQSSLHNHNVAHQINSTATSIGNKSSHS